MRKFENESKVGSWEEYSHREHLVFVPFSHGCVKVIFKGQGEKEIQQGLVSLLEVLFSCSCSRQRWLAGEQHKYTAVNICWPCNALNKQQA